MANKSAFAFRTISEVAADLDVPSHVLRFWESKFSQIRPLKRGGGRRYYRPEDVDLLREIRSLLYDEGYTIRGAQKLLKNKINSSNRKGVMHLSPKQALEIPPRPRALSNSECSQILEILDEIDALRESLCEN
ncbi:MAG: MerR family transcriptional regulator [Rhodospirillaceae bacterium]|jgi:DNA-binding transcriptional MerR regulator